jgi:hypothetical protein
MVGMVDSPFMAHLRAGVRQGCGHATRPNRAGFAGAGE